MSDLRNYWKSLNELKMLQLIFDDHFTELGYEKLNSTTFDLTNNIIVQFQPNSTDPSIIIADNSTNIITSYLFDPSIVFKESIVIKSQRQKDNYVFDDIIENVNIYSLLNLVTQQKEIYLID